MTVLGENAIKGHLARGWLVVKGDPGCAQGPSYSCHVAKVFPGGPGQPNTPPAVFDWEHPASTDAYRIQPRQLVWVRIREQVRLPPDICAFWWQTNTLSRKGLMLVNMSMVDPGYEGWLACLFVNFGREPVDIDPAIPVARLVFHRVEGSNPPFGKGPGRDEYDRRLREAALNGPSSFLGFQEFSDAFAGEETKAFAAFQASADAYAGNLNTAMRAEVDAEFKDKTENLPRFLLKSYVVAFVGFGLLTAALSVTPWVKDRFSLDVKKQVDDAVTSEMGRRLQPFASVNAGGAEALERRVQDLEAEIRSLKQSPGGPGAPGR